MKTTAVALFLTLGLMALPIEGFAQTFLVENGEPRTEIVIVEDAPRSTRLAAQELQTSIAQISGARLSVVTNPSVDVPVQIYVEASRHAEKLGITTKELKHGAYRIASGENWLALIGDDTDFVPIEPWRRPTVIARRFRLAGKK